MQRQANLTPEAFLIEELERRIKKNPSYSLRSFANALALSPGELSEILRSKRKISLKSANKIARGLLMSPDQIDQFLSLLQSSAQPQLAQAEARKLKTDLLPEDVFRVISDWYCFAILSLAELRDFKLEAKAVAKVLKISVTEASLALERLERVNALKKVLGKYEVNSEYYISSDEIPSEAVRYCHLQLLEKAKDAVETQSLEEREIGGLTFAVDPRQLPDLKRELKKFLDRFAEQVQKSRYVDKAQVYHLETILFRLTHKGGAS